MNKIHRNPPIYIPKNILNGDESEYARHPSSIYTVAVNVAVNAENMFSVYGSSVS